MENTVKKKTLSKNIVLAFTPKGNISKKMYCILAVSSFAIILGLWFFASYGLDMDTMFLPTPVQTFEAAINLFTKGGFIIDIKMSVQRVVLGFLISVVVGIPLGVLIGVYAPCAAFFEPFFSFARYLPASAFIQLFILWIGIDEDAKIAIIIVGSLAQIILMVATNVRNVSISLIEVSYTLGVSKVGVLWKVILPKCMPDIVDTLRIVLGWAWTYIIVAEMVGASKGIGFMITQAGRQFWVDKIFVGIITIGIIGLILDMFCMMLRRVLFPWNED